MIEIKNGRARSVRTEEETESLLAKDLENLTPAERATLDVILKEMQEKKDPSEKKLIDVLADSVYRTPPVDMRTFVKDPYFLGETCSTIYPKLLDDLEELFGGDYTECIFTGSIGYGKCLHSATIVNADTGKSFDISELVGKTPSIYSLTGETIAPQLAARVWKSGKKRCARLGLVTGQVLEASWDHPVLTSRGYRELRGLIRGDLVATAQSEPGKRPEYVGIESLRDIGVRDVYDLTVPATGNVVANGIVVHNTFVSSIGLCRVLYEISCLRDPHGSYGMSKDTNISIVALSVNESLAKKVVFENIVTKLKASPYFQENFPFDATKEELRFPNNIWVAPRATTDTSALGLSTISAIMDECLAPWSKVLLGDGTEMEAQSLLSRGMFEVSTFDFERNERVTSKAYIKRSGDQVCYKLALSDGSELSASWNHPVAVRFPTGALGFKLLRDTVPGDEVVGYVGIKKNAQHEGILGQPGGGGGEGALQREDARRVEPSKRQANDRSPKGEVEGKRQEANGGEESIFRENTQRGNKSENFGHAEGPKRETEAIGRDEAENERRSKGTNCLGREQKEDVRGHEEGMGGGALDPQTSCFAWSGQSELRETSKRRAQRGSSSGSFRNEGFARSAPEDERCQTGQADAYGGVQTASCRIQQVSKGCVQAFGKDEANVVGNESLEDSGLSIRRLCGGAKGWRADRVSEYVGASGDGAFAVERGRGVVSIRAGLDTIRDRRQDSAYVAGFLSPVQKQSRAEDGRGEAEGIYGESERNAQAHRRDSVLRCARLGIRDLGRELSLVRVVSKERLGVFPTYDISVPGYEVFVADGVLVHNTNFLPNKRSSGGIGEENRAETLYASIKRRMKSRFERQGKLPGMLFIVSSKRTNDDFTAKRIKESMTDSSIFTRDYATWHVKPEEYFKAKRFWVLCGNADIGSKILEGDEVERYRDTPPEGTVVIDVPEEFRRDFELDLEGAIRDIAGIASVSIRPFIQRREKIKEAIDPVLEHPLTTLIYDMSRPGQFMWDRMVANRSERSGPGRADFQRLRPRINPAAARHAHLDIGIKHDALGLTVAHISGWRDVVRRAEDGREFTDRAPVYVVDLFLRVIPPIGGEIVLSEVRHLLYDLTAHGYMITSITADQFQSSDSLQAFAQRGYRTQLISVDATPNAYDCLKAALYENRVRMYHYQPVIDELITLQEGLQGNRRKIDHPAKSSKDVADSFAAVVYTLSQQKLVEPVPILKSGPYVGDPWMDEQRQSVYAGNAQAGNNSTLLPFMIGNDDDEWKSPWRP